MFLTLKIGDNIAVSSLLKDEYTVLHPDNTVVVQVKTSRTAVEDEEESDDDDDDASTEDATEAAAAESKE